jgi:hypothetical protein
MLQLSVNCWSSALNARGSRLIIVVVKLGAVKIYVAVVEALRKKERQDETQFITKIDGFLSVIPRWMLMQFFAGFLKISPCVWPNSGLVLVLCFSYFTDNSIVPKDLQICIGSHSEKNSPIPCTLDPTSWIIRLVI